MKQKTLAILAAILLLAVIYAFCLWLVWEPWKLTRPEWTPAEHDYFTERHAFHGIGGSEREGNYYKFKRDGKWCRL